MAWVEVEGVLVRAGRPKEDRLPGFSASPVCWKCRGEGCKVCGGEGRIIRRQRAQRAARTTKGGGVDVGPAAVGGEAPGPGEALCCLCGHWRIFQKEHRYSTEDVATAWVASKHLRPTHVDLGTGVGSVLLFVAWQAKRRGLEYRGVGVEAQEESFRLAARSIRHNGAPCGVVLGDLRTIEVRASSPVLVTGTPPYYGENFGVTPQCEQSAGARYEFRGGIEAYCEAAARLLGTPEDRFVVCEGGLSVNLARVSRAAEAFGLRVYTRLGVRGKAGKPTLFGVWVMGKATTTTTTTTTEVLGEDELVVRDVEGRHTPEYLAVLREMGMR